MPSANTCDISCCTRTPDVPPELCDYIIDFLRSDKRSLATCALVTRNWLTRSQYHLFMNLKISNRKTLADFVSFLRGSPHLAARVCKLSLCGNDSGDLFMFESQFQVTVAGLAECVAELPTLDTLALHGVRWIDSSPHQCATLQQTLSGSWNLRHLQLKKVFVTPDVLFDTVCYFPKLRTLHAESVFWTLGIDRPAKPYRSPRSGPSLESVSLGSGCSYNLIKSFLPTLRDRVCVSNMHSLAIHFEHLDPWQEVKQFMADVAPQLKSLHISFGKDLVFNTLVDRFFENLNLAQCGNLEDIEVTLPGATNSNTMQVLSSWSLLFPFLSQLPDTLRSLTVKHRNHLETLEMSLGRYSWQTLDSLLCRFPSLSSVLLKSEATGCSLEAASFDLSDYEDLLAYWDCYGQRTEHFFAGRLRQASTKKKLQFEF